MNTVKSLLVNWRDKKTTLYFHIGTLNYDGQSYTFEYTHHSMGSRKIHDAFKYGYNLHPAFTELEKKYKSDVLFPAFDRRVPSSDRVNYLEILDDLGLPLEADRMDMLRETRGMISSDPYFFEEPLRLNSMNELISHFYISGMRHRNLPKDWSTVVKLGDNLIATQEKDNKYDSNAVRLSTTDGLWLGYIPGVYAQAVSALLDREVDVKLTINEKRPTYAPQWWIRINLEASLNKVKDEGFFFAMNELDELIFQVA